MRTIGTVNVSADDPLVTTPKKFSPPPFVEKFILSPGITSLYYKSLTDYGLSGRTGIPVTKYEISSTKDPDGAFQLIVRVTLSV